MDLQTAIGQFARDSCCMPPVLPVLPASTHGLAPRLAPSVLGRPSTSNILPDFGMDFEIDRLGKTLGIGSFWEQVLEGFKGHALCEWRSLFITKLKYTIYSAGGSIYFSKL